MIGSMQAWACLYIDYMIFTARSTLVKSVVFRLHVVCLSIRPSVTLVDQDHIGWKSWKIIARTISLTPSLFIAQRPSTYCTSRGTRRNFGETRGGVGKSGVLEHKSGNISETCKDR